MTISFHGRWAHPRSRGEHRNIAEDALKTLGSSPLARGTHPQMIPTDWAFGLIPARAGNTLFFEPLAIWFRAHPRSRGEHVGAVVLNSMLMGSSPLARGTLVVLGVQPDPRGLIPARAGNTKCQPNFWATNRAHPRSRGEHDRRTTRQGEAEGSSPLARGTLKSPSRVNVSLGLIPARAGNTRPSSSPSQPSRAHPRSRGEHRKCQAATDATLGSSPLARGTLIQLYRGVVNVGLIPARAGNTAPSSTRRSPQRAHPRSRGEHTLCSRCRSITPGSSPLARGTPDRLSLLLEMPGLIPARAGNTLSSSARRLFRRAHPRSRGEHAVECGVDGLYLGSSPLARGTPQLMLGELTFVGLIPARAGNTYGAY